MILLEVFIVVETGPPENSKEIQKSKKWEDKYVAFLVEHLRKGML